MYVENVDCLPQHFALIQCRSLCVRGEQQARTNPKRAAKQRINSTFLFWRHRWGALSSTWSHSTQPTPYGPHHPHTGKQGLRTQYNTQDKTKTTINESVSIKMALVKTNPLPQKPTDFLHSPSFPNWLTQWKPLNLLPWCPARTIIILWHQHRINASLFYVFDGRIFFFLLVLTKCCEWSKCEEMHP